MNKVKVTIMFPAPIGPMDLDETEEMLEEMSEDGLLRVDENGVWVLKKEQS